MNTEAKEGSTAKPRWLKIGLSILVTLHLWGVVAEPIRFATRGPAGPSPAASAFRDPIAPYTEFAYLSHGYAFFAPDPGPSHLVRAVWQVDDQWQSETFPDRQQQWPRLLYHRHFMLTEFLHNLHQPRSLPPDVPRDSPMFLAWREDRGRYEMVLQSYRGHLRNKHAVQQLDLERIEHRMPGIPEFMEEGIGLTDERLYRTLSDAPPDFEEIGP